QSAIDFHRGEKRAHYSHNLVDKLQFLHLTFTLGLIAPLATTVSRPDGWLQQSIHSGLVADTAVNIICSVSAVQSPAVVREAYWQLISDKQLTQATNGSLIHKE
ncbi:hypothetical protein, partial [Mycobacterium lepromatosis]|uniref:hypothetical protein n=1 Tax=Mycobacterium lepromatosis TaxID=480418 RepID=UPI0005F78CFB